MAANMIGAPVAVIAVSLGPVSVAMLNPKLTSKKEPYQTKEGCLSLDGQRPATRYQQIVVEYFDLNWQKQSLSLVLLPRPSSMSSIIAMALSSKSSEPIYLKDSFLRRIGFFFLI